MREINTEVISKTVRDLFLKANAVLPRELEECIRRFSDTETNKRAKCVFADMQDNLAAARELDIPICQDTGMAVVFIDIGQEVHITGGSLENAVNSGVSQAYIEGKLRCSVVIDPLNRINTEDNTPAVIHTRIVDGDKISLTAAPKGFGSENMSRLTMLTPAASREDIIDFVVQTVTLAGSNPCPPVVLGVGIGSTFEGCALLAKRALCRSVSKRNASEFYSALEEEMLGRINELNIGPQGLSGDCTALAVNIEYAPTHIAGLPVAVNVGCHVTRHASAII